MEKLFGVKLFQWSGMMLSKNFLVKVSVLVRPMLYYHFTFSCSVFFFFYISAYTRTYEDELRFNYLSPLKYLIIWMKRTPLLRLLPYKACLILNLLFYSFNCLSKCSNNTTSHWLVEFNKRIVANINDRMLTKNIIYKQTEQLRFCKFHSQSVVSYLSPTKPTKLWMKMTVFLILCSSLIKNPLRNIYHLPSNFIYLLAQSYWSVEKFWVETHLYHTWYR